MHIGILAHSADGAALCFLEMIRQGARSLGAHEHPEITLSILPMGPTLAFYAAGDLHSVNAHLMRTGQRLAGAGCDFFVCPDNTAHIALDLACEPFPLPGLHIAEIVAQQARADGRKRIGLLGTRWTMEGPAYPSAFASCGIGLVPPQIDDRELVHRLIFEELCQGLVSNSARESFLGIIERMKQAGCDGVALACTEIPILITPEVSPLPTLDSTRLLAQAAIEVALGQRPIPTWRGRPSLA